jgi:hypothetical protein
MRLSQKVSVSFPATRTQKISAPDATDDPVHSDQEERFFHGYYECYCYLPLYIFCGIEVEIGIHRIL